MSLQRLVNDWQPEIAIAFFTRNYERFWDVATMTL